MEVTSTRNIKVPKLLDDLKFYLEKNEDRYTMSINKQLLIDCYDVIKKFNDEGDDGK